MMRRRYAHAAEQAPLGAPPSICLKCPKEQREAREYAVGGLMYAKEIYFYRCAV
eukprot:COSAG01_NODE_25546_length_741_cov_1.183801_2_plen_54_part_00